MRTIKKLKALSYLLAILILAQSCSVYNKTTISQQEAIRSELPLKMRMNGKNYKIQGVQLEQEKLLIKAKRHSKLVKEFASRYVSMDGKTVVIDMTGFKIDSYREKNRTGSTVLTVLTVAGVAMTLGIIAFAISWGGGFSGAASGPILIL